MPLVRPNCALAPRPFLPFTVIMSAPRIARRNRDQRERNVNRPNRQLPTIAHARAPTGEAIAHMSARTRRAIGRRWEKQEPK